MGKAKRRTTGTSAGRRSKGAGSKVRGKTSSTLWRWPLAVAGIGAVAFVGILVTGGNASSEGGARLHVRVPELSPTAQAGQLPYEESCVRCHGRNAAGTNQGPPLVHRLYETSHHGDAAFWRAAQNGTRAHHWKYGNMPRVDVSENDMSAIIRYVRELQKANGIQ